MNKFQFIGRTTSDIEVKKTQSGKSVSTFTLAINRRTKEEGADFPQIIAWNKTAEILSQYVKKGNRIGISGHVQTRNYEGKNGKVYVTEFIAEEFEFLESKNSNDSQPVSSGSDSVSVQNDDSYGIDISRDDLPF